MRRAFTVLLAAMALVAAAAPSGAAVRGPFCEIRWGSLPNASHTSVTAPLTNVRAGRHTCFDRLVFDFAGRNGSYQVRYVSAIRGLGLDQPVDLRGGALLEIVLTEPYGPGTHVRYHPANDDELVRVAGWRTFRQVAWVELWESQSTFGLGVRARLPFRVFALDGPGSGSRIVIDVAHRW
jgi:hypothetical protein